MATARMEGDKIRVEWENIHGRRKSGIVTELDSNVLYVDCDDGTVAILEDGHKMFEWVGPMPEPVSV